MNTKQAIRLFVEDLKLAPRERDLVCMMFGANEIALRGEETLLPLPTALGALGLGPASESNLARMTEHFRNIMQANRIHNVGGPSQFWPVFRALSVTRDSCHIVFHATERACQEILALRARSPVDLRGADDQG